MAVELASGTATEAAVTEKPSTSRRRLRVVPSGDNNTEPLLFLSDGTISMMYNGRPERLTITEVNFTPVLAHRIPEGAIRVFPISQLQLGENIARVEEYRRTQRNARLGQTSFNYNVR